MARITGGAVRFERRVNTGNYEHKQFSADISWSAEDADDPVRALLMQERAAQEALDIVHRALGLEPVSRQAQTAVQQDRAPEAQPAPLPEAELVTLAPANVIGRPRRAAKPAVKTLAEEKAEAVAEARQRMQERVDQGDPLAADATQGDPLAGDATQGDPLAEEDFLSALPELTPQDTYRVMVETVKRLGDAIRPRQVLGRYAPQVSAIPPERRQAFVEELRALQ